MGCIQSKPSRNSPPRRLEKLKEQHMYVGKRGGVVGPRRSTGSMYAEREVVNARQSGREDGLSSGSSGGGDGRVVGREGEGGERNGIANVSSRRVSIEVEELAEGWPKWLVDNVPKTVLAGLVPKSAESYDKLDKVGQGTYSNVYKARDRDSGKIVALKKVKFDTSEPESIKFMAREITILRQLDHPNVLKLEGLATSRMQYSLYLVFDLMQSDLARIISRHERLTEPQIKCYMLQLLSGLQHCHDKGILHRDIKGSNLLIDKNGMLKIADFGLANYYNPNLKRPLTNRVVTLWYRAPELLLGATDYGVGIDLWSAGCLLAEMFLRRPIMPGRTEVEQLNRIFKLCGTPSEDYWKKLKLSTTYRPAQLYKPSLEMFSELPASSLGLLKILLSLDPAYRGSASSAIQNEFFYTSPLACDPSGLPVIHNDDDHLDQANKEKKKRRAKMRRSRSHGMPRKVDSSSEETENFINSKEVKDVENTVELNTQTEKQISPSSSSTSFRENPTGSTTTTSSISSGANLAGQKESPFSISSSSTLSFGVNPIAWKDTSSTTTSTASSSSNPPGQKESPPILVSSSSTRQRHMTGNYTTSSTSSSSNLPGQKESPPFLVPSSSARQRHMSGNYPTSSTSSSSNLTSEKESQLFPISPVRSPNQKMPVRTQRHSDANQNDKKLPPYPAKLQIRITSYTRDT